MAKMPQVHYMLHFTHLIALLNSTCFAQKAITGMDQNWLNF